jgi:L-asparaginase
MGSVRTGAVTVLVTTGGTIAMVGGHAGAASAVGPMVNNDLPHAPRSVIEHCCKPSVHLTYDDVLGLAAIVTSIAGEGEPVVVTHGTDVMEEVSFLCDLVYDDSAPIVFTGAMRLADDDAPDGPRNLSDALRVASADAVRDLGVLVCFAGHVHAARDVRKVDSVEIDAFASPHQGPAGEVADGLVTVIARPPRYQALPLPSELATVEVAFVGIGSDGSALQVLAEHVDGLVVSVPGAGHVPPPLLSAIHEIAAKLPVVVSPRPLRGRILTDTYGFLGSEQDLRKSGAMSAGALDGAKARMLLALCVANEMPRSEIADIVSRYDHS